MPGGQPPGEQPQLGLVHCTCMHVWHSTWVVFAAESANAANTLFTSMQPTTSQIPSVVVAAGVVFTMCALLRSHATQKSNAFSAPPSGTRRLNFTCPAAGSSMTHTHTHTHKMADPPQLAPSQSVLLTHQTLLNGCLPCEHQASCVAVIDSSTRCPKSMY